MKPTAGKRLYSTVDTTSVIVVRWSTDDLDLTCGGAAMSETAPASPGTPPKAGNTALGKRYVTDDGAIELLCTTAGDGQLAVSGAPLAPKSATPLPASD
ncbi:hypothetical protein GII33_04260 [Gordonia pseudamarae]|jgi:hypothetical protein|uniref:Uncharacterized protein n=1 Tax=Gordonia pseudamarae TaxID=2831662 RepID=A0ABX6IFV1_9ACTN|nr:MULTISPECIES: hypothetical protein [Gordonia]MBD0021730.1 hypothetical protein [Gordonia sp. (in: high G+C Gram-positive bacteria)]QHN25297.1 hypothetical protein GII33_04260 [Gordonia pseudamarae]QHN34229.1 hypothetical protein GII31_04255 [Gordonia pseudamarae]